MVNSIGVSNSYLNYSSNMINNRQKIEETIFNEIDSNKNGSLNKDEFNNLIDKISEETGLSINADKTFEKVDQDGDGAITKTEFKKFIKENTPPPPSPSYAGSFTEGIDTNLADALFSNEESSDNATLNIMSSLTQEYLGVLTSSKDDDESTSLQEALLKMKNSISQYKSLLENKSLLNNDTETKTSTISDTV